LFRIATAAHIPSRLQKQENNPANKSMDGVAPCAVMARDWNTNVPLGLRRRAFVDTLIRDTAAANGSYITAVKNQASESSVRTLL
jgi:hypothetical protein